MPFSPPSQVFHGADSDMEWLQRDFGVYVVRLFDTHQASRALNLARHSLDHLLTHFCSVTSDKRFQLADWRIRYGLLHRSSRKRLTFEPRSTDGAFSKSFRFIATSEMHFSFLQNSAFSDNMFCDLSPLVCAAHVILP